jgi:hypothetical protein
MRSCEPFALRWRAHRAALVARSHRPPEEPVRLVKPAFAKGGAIKFSLQIIAFLPASMRGSSTL